MFRGELTGVAGVPETAVSESLVRRLPADPPPAPWQCVCEAVVWCGRGGGAARAALPPALRHDAPGLLVVGGVVRYHESPVGAYDEIFGLVGSRSGRRPWGSVAFMSVDSEPSLVGGRTNWAMPKALGAFAGHLASGRTVRASGADETRWQVSATPTVIGPALPFRSAGSMRQQFPGAVVGDCRLRVDGRLRPAVVTVAVDSDGPLAGWLRPGRHLGALVERATFTLGAPRLG